MSIILKDSIIIHKEGDTATAQNNNTTLVIQQYKVGEGSWSSQPPSNLRPGEKIYTRFEYSYFIRGQRQKAYIPSEEGQEDLTWTFASALQDQVDGVINTWFGDEEPVVGTPQDVNNDSTQDIDENGELLWNTEPIPYGDWNSTNIDSNNTHLGDIYFNNSTGTAYRFVWENESPKWKKIIDEPMTQLLAQINSIKDTVDTKVSVFYGDNEPAAEINDLWAKNNQITLVKTENGWDIFNCTVTNIKKLYVSTDQEPTLNTLANFDWQSTIPSWSSGNSIWEITISLYVEDGLFDDLEFSKEAPLNKTHFVHITNSGVIFKENIGTSDNPSWIEVTIDGSVIDVTKPVCISVANRDVSEVVSQYAASDDNQNAPTSGWDTEITNFNSTNCYLWQKVITYYNDGSYDESSPGVCAFYSKDFDSITNYYYLHNSSNNPPSLPETKPPEEESNWLATPPETDTINRYIWMTQLIKFNNETYNKYTSPVLVSIDPVNYKLQLEVEVTEESSLAEISNSELEITGEATIIVTATLLDNSVDITDDSGITYSWYENGVKKIFQQPEREYSFNIGLDDSEIIISCIAELNGNEITRETITFSRIYSAKSFILSASAKAKRFIYNEKISTNPDNTNGNTSYELSSNTLYITVSQIIDETTSFIGQDKIWVQDKDGSLKSIDFDNTFNAYKFPLQEWYGRNYPQDPENLNDIIKFYLDSNGQTFIGYIEFEDGVAADQMKFFVTSAKMQAMIDDKSMMFNANGLSLYNGSFRIYDKDYDTIIKDNSSPVFHFDTDNNRLVLTGAIYANYGEIGGWVISENYLASMISDTKKRFLISSAVDSESLNWIQATDKTGNVVFKVGKDGYLTATGVNITGTITANTGYIGGAGGWTITTGAIYSGTTSMISTNAGTYIGTDGIRNYSSDNSYVDIQNGILTAIDANITGTITANAGQIGKTASLQISDNGIQTEYNLDDYIPDDHFTKLYPDAETYYNKKYGDGTYESLGDLDRFMANLAFTKLTYSHLISAPKEYGPTIKIKENKTEQGAVYSSTGMTLEIPGIDLILDREGISFLIQDTVDVISIPVMSWSLKSEKTSLFHLESLATAGNIYGLANTTLIEQEDNLDNYTTPGVYGILSNSIAESISNIPNGLGGRLIVCAANGEFQNYTGKNQTQYLCQEYYPIISNVFYRRYAYTSYDQTSWNWQPWYEFSGTQVS